MCDVSDGTKNSIKWKENIKNWKFYNIILDVTECQRDINIFNFVIINWIMAAIRYEHEHIHKAATAEFITERNYDENSHSIIMMYVRQWIMKYTYSILSFDKCWKSVSKIIEMLFPCKSLKIEEIKSH